jgi:hypothetical protein
MYELGFYIPEDGILHSHRRENLKSYAVKFLLMNPTKMSALYELTERIGGVYSWHLA